MLEMKSGHLRTDMEMVRGFPVKDGSPEYCVLPICSVLMFQQHMFYNVICLAWGW